MSEFPELKHALQTWANEAIGRLARDSDSRDMTTELARWIRVGDIFRRVEQEINTWRHNYLDQLHELESWTAVIDAIGADDRLRRQVDTLVGSAAHGGRRIEMTDIGRYVLPRPDEVDSAEEVFEGRYAKVESYLGADELEYKVVWTLPGLEATKLPIKLGDRLVLDVMTDAELGTALDTEIIRPEFPGHPLLMPRSTPYACLRYTRVLPKIVTQQEYDDAAPLAAELESERRKIQAAFEESLALISTEPVTISGRFGAASGASELLHHGVMWQPATTAWGWQQRRTNMDANQVNTLVGLWPRIYNSEILRQSKSLALALRRLSYQSHREMPEDELLDVMIAAEALYLNELGNEAYRGELRYRLALRAALWAGSDEQGFSRLDVLKLMQSAYDARSAVAHGGTPKVKEMKVRGERVSLAELVKATRTVIVNGCRRALLEAGSPDGWPPVWDALALNEHPQQLSS